MNQQRRNAWLLSLVVLASAFSIHGLKANAAPINNYQFPADDNSDLDLTEQVGLGFREPLWKDVPSIFIPYIQGTSHVYPAQLQYNTRENFLRKYRLFDIRITKGPAYRSVNWADVKLKDSTPEDIKQCWFIFTSGGVCGKEIPPPKDKYYTSEGTLDFLKYVRYVSKNNGLVVGRQVLESELAKLDASHGEIKKRILQTTQDKTLTFVDSISTIPLDERKDIGVYLVLGIGGEKSDNAALIHRAAEEIKNLGFNSEMLMVDANLGSDYNAKMLDDMLTQRIPKLKKVIFVAASKGAADFITYFFNYGEKLSQADREKVKLMVTLSGVIRPSFVAKFLTESHSLLPTFIRTYLLLSGQGNMISGLKTLAHNPWKDQDPKKIHRLFPDMKWLSLPAIPEGDDGVTHLSMWEGFLKGPAYDWTIKSSPMDGLVESAASVLPPDTDIEQYVVPVYGPHAMALGSYNKTLRVAPVAMNGIYDRVVPEAGGEMLSAMFRALPKAWLK